MSTTKRRASVKHRIPQNGELYDVDDFRLAVWELNQLGYDLDSIHAHLNVHRLHFTCNKTQNRFILECIGHNEWPESKLPE